VESFELHRRDAGTPRVWAGVGAEEAETIEPALEFCWGGSQGHGSLPTEDGDQLDNQDDDHQQLQNEGAAFTEFVDHEFV
jgi:hypothetical protein